MTCDISSSTVELKFATNYNLKGKRSPWNLKVLLSGISKFLFLYLFIAHEINVKKAGTFHEIISSLLKSLNVKVTIIQKPINRFADQMAFNEFSFFILSHSLPYPLKWLTLKKFYFLNLFLVNVPILYSLKTPENQRFSGVFRGI